MSDGRVGYMPLLDGLRAIAVTLVVAYHLDAPWMPGGFLGVDLFFVISGFLITTLLLRERDAAGSIGVGAFWSRRFRRLVPALAVMTAATVAMTRLWGIPEQWQSVRGDAFSALAYVANWRFIVADQSYFETLLGPSPLQHTWSLAVEEQWYVLWPLVVVALLFVVARRPRSAIVRWLPLLAIGAGTVGSAVLMAALYLPADPTRVYFGTDTRAQQLLVGAGLAWLMHLRPGLWTAPRRPLVGVAVLAALATFVAVAATTEDRAEWLYRGGFLAVSLVGVLVVWGVAVSERASALGWLAWAPLLWIGTRSYGIYLWHWPIIVFVGEPMGLDLPRLPLAAVQVALTLAAAELSFRLVEQPVRRSTWRPSLVIGSWSAATVVLLVVVAVVLNPPDARSVSATMLTPSAPVASPATLPVAPSDEPPASSTAEPTDAPETCCDQPPRGGHMRVDGDAATPPPAPATSDAGGGTGDEGTRGVDTAAERPTVLFLGDSTAVKLIDSLADRDGFGWNVEAYATIGCGLARGSAIDAEARYAIPREGICDLWREDWAFWRDQLQPDLVVMMVGAWEVMDHDVGDRVVRFPDADWYSVVREGVGDGLDIAGGGDAPVAALSLPCMRQTADSTFPATARNDSARVDAFNQILAELVAERPNAAVIDLASVLCPNGVYLEEAGGSALRYDGVHVTPEGADHVMQWLADEFDARYRDRLAAD